MDNLAKALAAKDSMSEATTYFERALTIRARVFGNDHPETNNTRVNWGTYLFQKKQFDKAGPLFNKAWQSDSLRFGPEHYFSVMDAVTYLACIREESASYSQKSLHKSALLSLNAAYEIACVLVENVKNSNVETKKAVIHAFMKLSTQAAKVDAIQFASVFDSLANNLLD